MREYSWLHAHQETDFQRDINHFNFFFSGFLSPMFFSGVVFPLSNLPAYLWPVVGVFPLTHSVRAAREIATRTVGPDILLDLTFIALFVALAGYLGIRRLRRLLVQ